ncbi:MAG: hypothetical protein JWO31_664 [Phycisphaerales bacterium]|nr:hypothetical protein [Phycisphaerales bacterium]
MSAISMAIEHGRPLADARAALRSAVEQTAGKFGPMVRHVAWSAAGDAVRVTGPGFVVDLAVDATHVRVTGELTGAAGMIAGPVVAGLKQIVQRAFQNKLPGGR